MYIRKLSLLNFKNIAQADLSLREGINCFTGRNGAGKTNVIDAVWYLSMCRSALTMTDGQSIRHGEEFFLLNGEYTADTGRFETVTCSFRRGNGKVLKRNGKEYERLSDHIGMIPAVIVSPADIFLVSDAADERRKWLNAFISQHDRDYLNALIRYNRALAERNAVNAPIQGTAADIIKLAMNRVDRSLREGGFSSRMVLQIHDELLLEVPEAEIEAVRGLLVKEMENVIGLSVPLTVECNYGKNWLEAH